MMNRMPGEGSGTAQPPQLHRYRARRLNVISGDTNIYKNNTDNKGASYGYREACLKSARIGQTRDPRGLFVAPCNSQPDMQRIRPGRYPTLQSIWRATRSFCPPGPGSQEVPDVDHGGNGLCDSSDDRRVHAHQGARASKGGVRQADEPAERLERLDKVRSSRAGALLRRKTDA
jgi:hypothetical protein